MRITGRITGVGQLGRPTGQFGNMYQDITVQDSNGTFHYGNIGTQQQGGYVVGPDIIVDSSESQYGTKFKRVDPQQQGQQQPQQNYQQQAPPPQQRPPQNKPRDYDKENTGKCRYGLYASVIRSGVRAVDLVKDRAELDAIEVLSGYSVHGLPPNSQGLANQFAQDQRFEPDGYE